MTYPKLKVTPIKEIIFSISYEDIIDENGFDKFIDFPKIKETFRDIQPVFVLEVTNKGITEKKDIGSFHLKNEKEVLQLRRGSFSYHFIDGYLEFDKILDNLLSFWGIFNDVLNKQFNVISVVVRYVNVIDVDEDSTASRLVQLYPKYSSDRKIQNFQNSVQFIYNDYPNHIVNVSSTLPKKDLVLVDVTVRTKGIKIESGMIRDYFIPLQDIKNKAFFDSITAKALLKYI